MDETQAETDKRERLENIAVAVLNGMAASGKYGLEGGSWAHHEVAGIAIDVAQAFVMEFDERHAPKAPAVPLRALPDK